jgi:hypothetical protein
MMAHGCCGAVCDDGSIRKKAEEEKTKMMINLKN